MVQQGVQVAPHRHACSLSSIGSTRSGYRLDRHDGGKHPSTLDSSPSNSPHQPFARRTQINRRNTHRCTTRPSRYPTLARQPPRPLAPVTAEPQNGVSGTPCRRVHSNEPRVNGACGEATRGSAPACGAKRGRRGESRRRETPDKQTPKYESSSPPVGTTTPGPGTPYSTNGVARSRSREGGTGGGVGGSSGAGV